MIEKIAKDLQLNIWDWIAVSIALLSLIVAFISLSIAWKTLKSQRQTAENTMPVISIGAQYESLISILILILENYINSIVLKVKTVDITDNGSGSDILLSLFKINTSDIHLELFYEDNLIDTEYNNLLSKKNAEDSCTERYSPYRIVAEYRDHLEEFNQKSHILELQYINNSSAKRDISESYALYVMKESLELILHTSSITSFLYPEHNIGQSLLSYIKKTEESCISRMKIEALKSKKLEYEGGTTRFKSLISEKAWHEIYDSNNFYLLQIMNYEEMKSAIATIAYCRYMYGTLKDYVIYK